MSFSMFWEKYFFKKRNIMFYDSASDASASQYVHYMSMETVDVAPLLNRVDAQFSRYLLMREGDPGWVLFYYEEDNIIKGYSFLHMPQKEEWNDSLPTIKKTARVSSNFVCPEFRGKNILSKITNCQIGYARKHGVRLWSVVENSNLSAMRATEKKASAGRVNYLIKFYKRNVFSVLTNPFQVYVLLGGRRARR